MPTWDKIFQETDKLTPLALLEQYISKFFEISGNSVICYFSSFTITRPYQVPPPLQSIVDQDMQGFMTCTKGAQKGCLDLIIHTPGGDYEATKRIINYLLSTYKKIRVFVPHMAMSGGTLLACAGDEIYMGDYSSLGPTDPQILISGRYVPVGAVISEFQRAFSEVDKNPKSALLWNERLKQVPLGLIEALTTMKKNSNSYLEQLLSKRNCAGEKIDDIKKIVKVLNSHEAHSSHGKGIFYQDAKKIGLNVKRLNDFKDLEEAVLSVYHAAIVVFQKTHIQKIIANHLGKNYIQATQLETQLPAGMH